MALKRYYEKAAQTFDINKQMFANEACKGVQLLDLLEQRYDVVATNPQYMYKANMGDLLKEILKLIYPDKFIDLYSAFIERCSFFAKKNGIVAMVTHQSFMFISMFEPTRKFILENTTIRTMIHLEPHAFDDIGGEKVNIALFSIKIANNPNDKSLFIKATETLNKDKHIRAVLHSVSQKKFSDDIYLLSQSNFKFIKGYPFAYWVDEKLNKIFSNDKPLSIYSDLKHGVVTGNNDIFLRYFWESSFEKIGISKQWVYYIKGGESIPYYGNLDTVIHWGRQDKIIENPSHRICNDEFFFRVINPTLSFQIGDVSKIPYIPPPPDIERRISAIQWGYEKTKGGSLS